MVVGWDGEIVWWDGVVGWCGVMVWWDGVVGWCDESSSGDVTRVALGW